MDEERKPWEQRIDEGESDLWYGRFRAYLRMGTKRSVNAIYKKEFKSSRKGENQRTLDAGGEWYDIEKTWDWKGRARKYDECQRAEEDRIIAEEKDKVLRSGYALMHKRVQLLDRLSRKLERIEKDESKMWIPETRTTIMGEDKSVHVEKVTFNHHVYALIDKYQDSIAKEMGERVKKQEITGKDGGPIQIERDPNLQSLTDEELSLVQRIAIELSQRQGSTD